MDKLSQIFKRSVPYCYLSLGDLDDFLNLCLFLILRLEVS